MSSTIYLTSTNFKIRHLARSTRFSLRGVSLTDACHQLDIDKWLPPAPNTTKHPFPSVVHPLTAPALDQNASAWTTMDHVNGVTYNVAGAMTAMSYLKTDLIQPFSGNRYFVESRAYDELNQLTRQTTVVNGAGPTVADIGYCFSTTANNGRITSRTNYVSGESVAYQYDALNRLLSATATGGSSPYTMTFLFDGFGNRWDQRTTAGTGPTTLLTYNYNNNQLSTSGYGYLPMIKSTES